MNILLLVLLVGCLGCFSWARRKFFKNSASKHRRGLAPLGTIFGVLMAIVVGVEVSPVDFSVRTIISAVLFILSMSLFWASIRAFGKNRPSIAFSPGAPEKLIIDGPYRYLRHPFYSAYMLCWIGCFSASPGFLTLLPSIVMGYLYYKAASSEETLIRGSELGPVYEEYAKNVGMFFPRLGSGSGFR